MFANQRNYLPIKTTAAKNYRGCILNNVMPNSFAINKLKSPVYLKNDCYFDVYWLFIMKCRSLFPAGHRCRLEIENKLKSRATFSPHSSPAHV